MTKKYIVIVSEDFSAKTKDKITDYFQSYKANIWHWISNIWLVIDEENLLHRNKIREDLQEIVRFGPVLIFETSDPNLCSGIASPNQAKWIMENWINEEPQF
ncbi:hypothetical protein HZ320_00995 [[Pasteurella] aerogenes]|nr:hypothetical protein HZ320_00995 [[Pasteurella] aerogenes]